MSSRALIRATRLDQFFTSLGERLLFLWVRTTVLPLEGPKLDARHPVVYVLETRALSSALVLNHQTRQLGLPSPWQALSLGDAKLPRRVMALKARQRAFGRPPRMDYREVLEQLLDTLHQHPTLEVLLQPVTVFWGRSPGREPGGLALLFPDDWPLVGRLRKLLLILLHGRNTWVEFSQPVSLRRYLSEVGIDHSGVRKLSLTLGVHFRRRREAVLGPELPARHTIIETIVNASHVQAVIREEAQHSEFTEAQLRITARKYAEEIAAGFSYPLMLLVRRGLHWLWHRLYDGIQLHHFETLETALPGNQVVYVPCHRSHIDYLLILYMLYSQGLALPRVAAGINLNAPGIGFFIRRGGAFFLRRTFKGNRLYATVLDEYMSLHLARGVPIKYFIEGGRSRSGFLLAPKMGMLDMTVRGFFRYPYRPVVFIPLYIGYERLVEGESYIAELSGEKKRRESLLGLIRSLWSLKRYYGQVYLNVAEPVDLETLLAREHPSWREETRDLRERPDWLPPVVAQLARDIQVRVNQAAAVTPVNLFAMVLLGAPRRAMARETLLSQLALYQQLLATLPYHPRVTLSITTPEDALEHAGQLVGWESREDELGEVIYLEERPGVLLAYFRNNTLHLLALPALLARSFQHSAEQGVDTETLEHWLALLYPGFQDALFLQWATQELPEQLHRHLAGFAQLGLLKQQQGRWFPANSEAALQLALLGRNVDAGVSRLAVCLLMLIGNGSGVLDTNTLLGRYRQYRERMDLLHQIPLAAPEERIPLTDLLASLEQRGWLWQDPQGCLCFDGARLHPELHLERLLPAALKP